MIKTYFVMYCYIKLIKLAYSLEHVSMDKENNKKGRMQISVREHCEHAISINWSR